MITPSAVDLLRTVETMLASLSDSLSGNPAGKSAVATARGLLRHTAIRIECEGQLLSDDIRALHELLPAVSRYLAARADDHEADLLAAEIDRTLATQFRPEGCYADLVSLAQEAGVLREQLYKSLALLQSRRNSSSNQPGYLDVRARIRAYCTRQLEAEADLIEPAFAGQGPRR